jgi:hypothetical protein
MRVCILASVFGMLVSAGLAGTPGFNPGDVVRQVRTTRPSTGPLDHSPTGFDDGEFLIDTSSTLGPAPSAWPALAFDGENFLAVWVDSRGGASDIIGARVTPAGVVLDSAGIAISTAADDQTAPALAFDGENFLVVWGDWRNSDLDVYGARVSPAGEVLDPLGIAVSTAPSLQQQPAPAFDGSSFLVVWQDDRDGASDVYGARVTRAGAVLDPSGIPISAAVGRQGRPSIAFDGVNSLVAWTDDRGGTYTDIYGARVTPAGTVLDTAGIPVSTAANDQQYTSLAFDGEDFLVVWSDRRGDPWSSVIYGARVTPAGAVLDPAGISISTGTETDVPFPALVFDGANFLVVWQDIRGGSHYDIHGARVTPAGTVLDPSGIAISTAEGGQEWPALAFDGTKSLVVWGDARDGLHFYIHGARVTQAGTVLDTAGIGISFAANSQLSPTLAFDGANFLVVWEDERGGSDSDIYGARVTPAGVVLDPQGIAISTVAAEQNTPAVTFDSANFLVVWEDCRDGTSDIYGARVTPGGAVLDPAGIAISTATNTQSYPAIAFDGANFLVIWQDERSGIYSHIYGARVTPGGAVLDPAGIAISTATGSQSYPALAFDGENYLATWSNGDIYGARVTPAGVVLDPAGIAISTATNTQSYPALAFDGANFLVAWQDGRVVFRTAIYGARVTPGGTVLDPSGIPISARAYVQEPPALGFDGANFLAVWQGGPSGMAYDIYGARVTSSGVVLDSGPVVRQEGYQVRPALARGTDNQIFLVYQGWAGTVGSKTYNTQRVWGKMNPSPAIAEMLKPEVRMTNGGATIVRGVLLLPEAVGGKRLAGGAHLLDVSGREVLDLRSGPNCVRALAPGVYFVRQAQAQAQAQAQVVPKVIITK